MALQVTFEKGGDRILARTPISLHWCRLKDTYGIELRQNNDYRNDHTLETRLLLTASRHRGRTIGVIVGGEFRRFEPPRNFPIDLSHDFLCSDSIRAKIEKDWFSAAIDLVSELPWDLATNRRDLKLDVVRDEPTSLSTLRLHFHLSLVFRASQYNPHPLEFDWGTPGVYSSHFESNRRKH
jgi:hypothetical protein